MPDRNIIVIGASAGGVETLIQLCKKLPQTLPAALFVAVHFPNTTPSLLPRILTRSGDLQAIHPQEDEEIHEGVIYVAPVDYHLDIFPGRIRLSHGPRENGFRPSIDRMFRSAAQAYGPRVVGVILSGMLSDGALGLQSIHEAGGMTIVQDPQEAIYPSMPESALRSLPANEVLPLAGIASRIIQLSHESLTRRLAQMPADQGRSHSSKGFQEAAQQAEQDASDSRAGAEGTPGSITSSVLPDQSAGGSLKDGPD